MQDQESSGYDDELDDACESVPDDEVQVGTGDGASGDAQDVRGNGGLTDVQAGAGDERHDVQGGRGDGAIDEGDGVQGGAHGVRGECKVYEVAEIMMPVVMRKMVCKVYGVAEMMVPVVMR